MNTTTDVLVNGVSVKNQLPAVATWTTITGITGRIESIELIMSTDTPLAGGTTPQLRAIRLDGTVLVDGADIWPAGTIIATDSVTVPPTLTLSPSLGTWTTTNTAVDISRVVTPPAPPSLPPDPTKYTAVTGSPYTGTNQAGLADPEVLVPQADLSVSSTYYARVQYATTNASAATSNFSNWSSFATASSFLPDIGTAMSGGYFGGQINDGGIIYNLIVADLTNGGQDSTKAWKSSASADTVPSAAFWQNEAYGFPATQAGYFTGAGTYPAFGFARTYVGNGYKDWYIPAKNELEVLFYFLRPNVTGGNSTSSGSNPNAVAPEPVSQTTPRITPLKRLRMPSKQEELKLSPPL